MAGKIPVGDFNTRISLDGEQPIQTLKSLKNEVSSATSAWKAQVTDPSGQEFMQYGPDIRPNPRDYILGNCDVVARMVQKPQTGERGLIMQGSIDTYAKNRLDGRKGCKVEDFFEVQDK